MMMNWMRANQVHPSSICRSSSSMPQALPLLESVRVSRLKVGVSGLKHQHARHGAPAGKSSKARDCSPAVPRLMTKGWASQLGDPAPRPYYAERPSVSVKWDVWGVASRSCDWPKKAPRWAPNPHGLCSRRSYRMVLNIPSPPRSDTHPAGPNIVDVCPSIVRTD